MYDKPVRVIIAASGTGGHLFPAAYVAEAFKKKCSELTLEFIGSGRPLEEKILGHQGFRLNAIETYGVKNTGVRGMLRFLLSLPKALFQTMRIFQRVKPQVVIGIGGYVTVLPVILARIMGIPTWIHEAELRPGMANELLKHFATKVSLAFREASLASRRNAEVTGHPVRQELRQVTPGLALGGHPSKILVLGGSQGAQALDVSLPAVLSGFEGRRLDVLHQCRKENVSQVESAYNTSALKLRVQSFIDDMAAAYSWCDVVIARAGAGTVMELGVVNRPAVLVPYPHAQGNHQAANAATLVKAGKAIVVEEGSDFELRLKSAVTRILEPETYFAMKLSKFESRSLNAADKICQGCLNLIKEP